MGLLIVIAAVVGFVLPVARVLGRTRVERSSRTDAIVDVARWPMPTSGRVSLDRHRPAWPVPRPVGVEPVLPARPAVPAVAG